VLVKVITLVEPEGSGHTAQSKLNLIDQISTATNQQTAVTPADRMSNEQAYIDIQRILFEKAGVLLERKRGEFADGMNQRYVSPDQILDRNLFARIYHSSLGLLGMGRGRRMFTKLKDPEGIAKNLAASDTFGWAYMAYLILCKKEPSLLHRKGARRLHGMIYASVVRYRTMHTVLDEATLERTVDEVWRAWPNLITFVVSRDQRFLRRRTAADGSTVMVLNPDIWMKEATVYSQDIADFFGAGTPILVPAPSIETAMQ
jgi:hypothetical protein